MAVVLGLVVVGWIVWIAFAIGDALADRRVNINYHKLAMFAVALRGRDDMVPFLHADERSQLDHLVDEYTSLNSRTKSDSGAVSLSSTAVVLVMVVAVVLVTSALITACSTGPSLTQGKVIEKDYDDADSWYQSGYSIDGGQTCTGGYGGQSRVCVDNADTHIPGQWHNEPERFLLKLQAPDPEDDSKTITDTVSVPENFWDDVRVGQWVDVKAMEIINK